MTVWAFLATFFGALLAGWIARKRDSSFRQSVASTDASSRVYPQSHLLRVACYLVFAAWAALVGLMAVVVLLMCGVKGIPNLAFTLSLAVMVTLVACYVTFAMLLRCPQCSRYVTIQLVTNPPYVEKVRGHTGWSAVIVSAAFDRKFQCMYCGQRFHVT